MVSSSGDRWRVELLERRRVVFEQLLWQIPSASFAGQAFLLTIVLRTDTSPTGRLVAALFGLGAAIGVLVAYVKHRYTEEIYAESINANELREGRPKLVPAAVAKEAFEDRSDEDRFTWEHHPLRALTKLSAFQTWATLLVLFVFGDLLLVVVAIVEVAGGGSLFT